jgi:hypothetical protein
MVTFDVKIQYGQIGIRQTQPQLDMQIKNADVELIQQPYVLQMSVSFPQIEKIDQKECFREIGLVNFMDSIRETAQEAQAHVIQAIERIAQQGDQIAHIENKSVTIGKVFGEVPDQEKSFNVDVAPKSRPKITFREGEIRSNFIYGYVKPSSYIPADIGYSFRYGTTNIYLEKEPYIKISSRGTIFDYNA